MLLVNLVNFWAKNISINQPDCELFGKYSSPGITCFTATSIKNGFVLSSDYPLTKEEVATKFLILQPTNDKLKISILMPKGSEKSLSSGLRHHIWPSGLIQTKFLAKCGKQELPANQCQPICPWLAGQPAWVSW